MPKYVKQTWNNYDKSLTLEENINRNAVVTKENMDHIERGVHFISAAVEQLETTLQNIPENVLEYLQTISQEIENIKSEIQILKENSVDDLTLTENKLQVSANGVPLGEGVDIVTPTIDDASYDGVSDGVVNVDNIDYAS